MSLIMLVKCFAAIFAFPCTTILLTNSAVSLRVLGTLNGVATSVSAVGRAAGPAIGGAMFEVGAVKGWAILPWWVLAGFAMMGAVPVWWLVETEGFAGSLSRDESSDGEEQDDDAPEVHPHPGGRGGSENLAVGSLEAVPRDGEDDILLEDEGLLSTNSQLSRRMSRSNGSAAVR